MPADLLPDDAAGVVRLVVMAAVVWLLVRAARAAWPRRALAVRIWRAIRPRHVVGSLGLLAVVLATAVGLLVVLPVTGIGLGSLVGLEGNAIFAPIDGALEAPLEDPAPVDGGAAADARAEGSASRWPAAIGVTAFLGLLVLLFPHLAHAEEQVFRTGWEDHTTGRQVASALRFGLAHLVMLIPIAAALAVAVAGFAYGRIYRRAYRRAATTRMVVPDRGLWVAEDAEGITRLVLGPPTPVAVVDRAAARQAAVLEAAVWHTTANTTIAVLVWVGYLLAL